MTTEREALKRALDLFNGKAYGKNASNETIAKRWLEWEKQARAALAAQEDPRMASAEWLCENHHITVEQYRLVSDAMKGQ